MAKPTPPEMVQLGPWPGGLNNVAREDSLSPQELREDNNVDIVKQGKLETRGGYALSVPVVGARSLWGDGDFAFYALNNLLYELVGEASAILRFSALHATNAVCFARTGPQTYFSDQVALRRYDVATQAVLRAAPERPNGAPTLVVGVGTGGWRAGQYLVAVTFQRVSGEESAPSDIAIIDLAEGDGISVSSLPQPADADIVAAMIYVSDANEPVLYYRRAIPAGITSTAVGFTAPGASLRSQHMGDLPAGHALAFYASRLYSAKDNVLYASEPYQYGVCDLLASTISYPKKIALLAPVSDGADAAGLFVGSGSRTYFVSGNTPQAISNQVVYPHGVVFGSMAMAPASAFDPRLDLGTSLVPMWLAKNGVICVGTAGGRVVPMTEGRCVTNIYERAAAMYRTTEGAPQYVVAAPASGTQAAARATDVMTFTVVQNGIVVASG